MNKLTIAYYQQNIIWENPQANFIQVEEAFSKIQEQTDILVVPETFSTGFSNNMAQMAESPDGASYEFALHMARKHTALFVGTWPVATPQGVFNRLFLVSPNGILGQYDKAHTFRMSTEHKQLQRGTQQTIVRWRDWNIKPAVCYDLRFPQWLRNKANPDSETHMDYDLMILCANWPESRHEAWTTLLKARAIENLSYVLGVNRIGTDGLDIPYGGHSALINFRGQEISSAPTNQEQVVVSTISCSELQRFRQHWPFYLDFD